MKDEQLTQRRINATPRGIAVLSDFYITKAENATLWDQEGNSLIDFTAGIAVVNTGHRHPKIVQAIQQQLECFTHTAYQIIPYESYTTLAERLNKLAPIQSPCKTAFFTTGAEAVENAIKIARAHTKRPGIISFASGFHGRTYLAMSMTGKVAPYKLSFGPFPGSIYHALYPNQLQNISINDAINSIKHIFHTDIEPTQVAAIILEPIQGEGGFNIAPPEFMQQLYLLCKEHGILLIADEIQTGFARTGKMFAMQYYPDVEVDIITMAKSIAGGMPLSAVCGRAEVMDSPLPGGLGGTYAGHPLSIAAAHAVLDVIETEQLCNRSRFLGAQLVEVLQRAKKRSPAIAEVRSQGSMVAVEFIDPLTKHPSGDIARQIQQKARQQNLLLLTCGNHGNVIRFLYPLTIPEAQFNQALTILTRILTE